jgi:hypothetical protein
MPNVRNAGNDARARSDDKNRGRVEDTQSRDMRERPVPPRQQLPSRPKWPIPLALLGVLGLALAAILGWGVAPARSNLPTNYNQTRDLTGTANAALNVQALTSGNVSNAVITNTPVTGQQTIRVLDTSGDNARVLDERTLSTDGAQLGTTSNTFAVNRSSLEPASNPPSNWNATQAQGLTVSFPAGAKKQDYQGWVPDILSTSTIHFVREESRGGVNTFVYQQDTPATPITNQTVLSTLPASLTPGQLGGLAPSLPLTADQRSALTQALPNLPDSVPITYTYQAGTTYWVEPTSGTIVDTSQSVVRNGVINGPGGATLANLAVLNLNQRFTDQSVAAAGTFASDRKNSINGIRTIWPAVLGTLGGLALIAGLLGMLIRRRARPQPATPQPTYRPAEPTTYRSTEATQRGTTETDAARRRETQAGAPQAPYAGQTPHTGPYRESTSGQQQATPGEPPAHAEGEPQRGQGQPGQGQGQQGQGPQQPRGGGG